MSKRLTRVSQQAHCRPNPTAQLRSNNTASHRAGPHRRWNGWLQLFNGQQRGSPRGTQQKVLLAGTSRKVGLECCWNGCNRRAFLAVLVADMSSLLKQNCEFCRRHGETSPAQSSWRLTNGVESRGGLVVARLGKGPCTNAPMHQCTKPPRTLPMTISPQPDPLLRYLIVRGPHACCNGRPSSEATSTRTNTLMPLSEMDMMLQGHTS